MTVSAQVQKRMHRFMEEMAESSDITCLKFLIDNGIKIEPSVMTCSASHGNLETVIFLIENGGDYKDAILNSDYYSKENSERYLIQKYLHSNYVSR
jgi:hypothetical protein